MKTEPKSRPKIVSRDVIEHNEWMLADAELHLAECRNPINREYLEQAVAHYRARLGLKP